MADRFRLALLTIALCLLPMTAGAQNPSPSFAVRIEGRGPAMILIPGFVSSGEVWDDVVAHYWAEISDPQAASSIMAELMTTDLREPVAAIRTPVLLIPALKMFASMPGGEERARAAYSAQLTKVASHQVVAATNALHFVMFDDLPFLLKTMDAFLGPVTSTRSER